MSFSPSRRTASSIVTDCQSEAVGLIVIINRTGREYLMRLKRALDGVRVFDDFVKCPSLPPFFTWKAFVQRAEGRGGRFQNSDESETDLNLLTCIIDSLRGAIW